jgi:hypothetical protein
VLELHGVLYFSWVVPGAGLVALFALAFLPLLRRLPARPRGQFLLAGGLYVAGALGMELPLGWWTERAGEDTLVYAVLDHVEEVLELVGASLFLAALVEQLGLRLRVTLAAEGQPEEGAHGHAARRAG